jgi:hypothetical protein
MSSQIYQQILASIPSDLHLQLMTELSCHIGSENRVTKIILIKRLFGKVTSTTDRQTRDAIADLQEAGFPVLSDSSDGGYWLASTSREADAYLNEIDSRIKRLSAKRKGIIKGLNRFCGPPTLF